MGEKKEVRRLWSFFRKREKFRYGGATYGRQKFSKTGEGKKERMVGSILGGPTPDIRNHPPSLLSRVNTSKEQMNILFLEKPY